MPSFLAMIVEGIGAVHNPTGASRAAIANFIANKYNKEKNALFNSNIRQAIAKGLNENIIKQGNTAQRFKLGDNVNAFRKSLQPKKPRKKKTVSKKKKTTSKKKKTASKKKKTTSKKKKAAPKRKTTSKRKSASKKKAAPKRKTASKKKKTSSKRRSRK